MALHLEQIKVLLFASGQTDFAVDGARSLSAKVVFSGHMTRVTRQIFAGPGAGVGGKCRAGLVSGSSVGAGRLDL